MARFNFGGALTDFAITSPSARANAVFAQPNAAGSVYAARTGGSALTDLLDSNGAATTTVSSDTNGFVNRFQGPDGYAELWIDFGGGSRFFMRAVDGAAPRSFLGTVFPTVMGDITALQAAADAAATAGTRVVTSGTITTSTTLTLKCDADLSGLTINYSGTGTAIVFGDSTTAFFRRTVRMPKVVATLKTGLGWTAVAGTVGIDVVNAYSCNVTIPYVQNFETGLRVRGASSNGTQQTTFMLGHLDNNKVNIRFTGDATGWANQDHFYGGRCSHNSNEGSQVSGTRHVLFENIANPVNGHHFFGTSLESPDVVEYHIEAANTTWCTFWGSRFENTGGDTHRRILSSGASKNNRISGGAYAENITQTVTSPAQPFDIDSNAQTTRHGGTSSVPTMLLENVTGSGNPLLTFMAAGAGTAGSDPSTAYTLKASANQVEFKRSTDSFNRTLWDGVNGRLYLGDATAAPVGFIGGSASALFVGGSVPLTPLANGSQDLGSSSLRWRRAFSNNLIQPQSTKTANYTLVQDVDNVVIFNGTSLTATLPDPTGVVAGGRFTVKNINSTSLTVNSAGTSKTLDGAASQSLAQWAKATYVSDGTQWLTV